MNLANLRDVRADGESVNCPTASTEDRPVSIVHMIPNDAVGGVEVAARSMLPRTDLPCHFQLLVVRGPTLAPPGSNVITSRYRRALDPRAQLNAVREILRARPDVLVASLWRTVPAALLAKLLRPRMRLALMLHTEVSVDFRDASFDRVAMQFADEIWGDCAATLVRRQVPKRKRTRKISFVTHRLAPARSDDPAPAPTFVSFARMAKQKGIDRAMRLIAELRRMGIDARFDVYGHDDGQAETLLALRDELGLNDHVSFRGVANHDDLPKIAAEHSFYLLLSRFEGMSMSTVEAMQLGLVPVTTAVGQMADYVRHDENGIIVDPDRIEQGARDVAQLLGDAERYRAVRRQAIEHWQRTPLYADDLFAAADSLAKGHERSRPGSEPTSRQTSKPAH